MTLICGIKIASAKSRPNFNSFPLGGDQVTLDSCSIHDLAKVLEAADPILMGQILEAMPALASIRPQNAPLAAP